MAPTGQTTHPALFGRNSPDYSPKTPIAPGKFRIHAKIANSLIEKGWSPTTLYGSPRGRIVFAPKTAKICFFGRPEYALNHSHHGSALLHSATRATGIRTIPIQTAIYALTARTSDSLTRREFCAGGCGLWLMIGSRRRTASFPHIPQRFGRELDTHRQFWQ